MSERKTAPNSRIQFIDALRGLSIVLMVAYHAGVDLVLFKLIPQETLYNPLLGFLEPFFAGIFIVLSGISARYSHDNRARGVRVLGCALIVSLATGIMGLPIYFGILHCLGCCMIAVGDPVSWLDRIPRRLQPFLFVGLFIVFRIFLPQKDQAFGEVPYLYIFGLYSPDLQIVDYFPLLPWFFLYLTGAWLGLYIRENRFPGWFYSFRAPILPVLGRHTLLIYMLHQPIIYFSVMGLARFLAS